MRSLITQRKTTMEKNYQVASFSDVEKLGRLTFNESLALTGSEISFNELPVGAGVPFLHTHKENEEVYIILKGKGLFQVDGEEFPVEAGNIIRVDPAGERGIMAEAQSSLRYICIQTEAHSLQQHTQNDAAIKDGTPTWSR